MGFIVENNPLKGTVYPFIFENILNLSLMGIKQNRPARLQAYPVIK